MRIFQALRAPATGGLSQSSIWLRNLHEPLVELGHEVYLWRFERDRSPDLSQKLLDDFWFEHNRKPFDLFFSYFQDGMVKPEAISEIVKTGVPACNFSCNNIHQFNVIKKLSPEFSFNLYAEKDAKRKFDDLGVRSIWFPMAANPRYYRPLDIPRTTDVSFTGQEYAKRYLYIWHLLNNGIDVHVAGPAWRQNDGLTRSRSWARRVRALARVTKARQAEDRARLTAQLARRDLVDLMVSRYGANFHGPVADEEMIRTYSASRISLGFLEVFDEHDQLGALKQHVHLREFEAPMSGALYCTGYHDELTEFYEPEKEVITYRNEHELLEKVRYYLAHEAEADKIRRAGRRRALECHTYQKRFQDLFKELNLE